MSRYIWMDGDWHEVSRETRRPKFPSIIRDHMEPLKHMATGEIMDSKSAFRAATKAAGCVELGNDAPIGPPPRQIDRKVLREDIAQAISELEQGRPAPRPVSAGEVVRKYA